VSSVLSPDTGVNQPQTSIMTRTITDPDTEPSAWIRAVLERQERPLTAYAARILGDVDRARDAVQETFLRLCNQDRDKLQELQGRVDLWLFTVCRNLCSDQFRKEQAMTSLDEDNVRETPGQSAGPAETAQTKDSYSKVLANMESLPAKQQEVLRLKFQQGLSYKEISQITQDSLGNVGWLLHMGLKNLRERMAGGETQGVQA
jgi:RNA polymerase sigma factor (sigma-70 family)